MGHFVIFFSGQGDYLPVDKLRGSCWSQSLTHSLETFIVWLPMAVTVKFKVLILTPKALCGLPPASPAGLILTVSHARWPL